VAREDTSESSASSTRPSQSLSNPSQNLVGCGVDVCVGVVAVPGGVGGADRRLARHDRGIGPEPVAVAVDVPGGRVRRVGGIHHPVAVVVDPVADLVRPGVDVGVGVVAVVGGGDPVAVRVLRPISEGAGVTHLIDE
jgi:hypothetical protein